MPWLLKTEPSTYSIEDLERDKKTNWDCIRNYQARNYLRDDFKLNDQLLIYHSSAESIGIVGLARVSKLKQLDQQQFNPKSDYYDPKATIEKPIWYAPEIEFVRRFKRVIELSELRSIKALKESAILKKGNRLSVIPLSDKEFESILDLVSK